MAKTWVLSDKARAVLATGVVRDGRLYLDGRPSDPVLYREVKRALEAMGWRWDKQTRSYVQVADPVAALARAVETGEVGEEGVR